MELPTGAVYKILVNGEKVLIDNADFDSSDEFGNYVYNYLEKSTGISDIDTIQYIVEDEIVFEEKIKID